tara:strand:- start:51 stop:848 length:798 start_codon:yes stop_codon:yes gene_type:complete
MAVPFLAMGISAGVSAISSLFGAGSARRAARKAKEQAAGLNRQIAMLEKNRQAVINPYENVKDLSSMVTNPFANLQVATKAAEIQGAETDIALATTLDTLRATGAGSGGATALAQAAARSKSGISAGIEKQEAQNTRLRAQGEQQMQRLQMSEAARVQGAQAQGKAFKFNAQETRDTSKLNRLAGQADIATGQASAYSQQASQMMGSALGALGGLAGAAIGSANYKNSLGGGANTSPATPGLNSNYNYRSDDLAGLFQTYGTPKG